MVPIEFSLVVHEDGASPEELDAIRMALLSELRDFELERAEPLAEGEVPSGAKSAEALTVAAIALAAMPSVLPKLVEFLEHWVLRSATRTIKLKLSESTRTIELELPASSNSREDLESLLHLAHDHLTRLPRTNAAQQTRTTRK